MEHDLENSNIYSNSIYRKPKKTFDFSISKLPHKSQKVIAFDSYHLANARKQSEIPNVSHLVDLDECENLKRVESSTI